MSENSDIACKYNHIQVSELNQIADFFVFLSANVPLKANLDQMLPTPSESQFIQTFKVLTWSE